MPTVKELREKAGPITDKILLLRDKAHSKDGWTDEERNTFKTLNDEYNALARQIDELSAVEEAATKIEERRKTPPTGRALPGRNDTEHRPAGDEPSQRDADLALAGWMRYQYDLDPTEEQIEAARRTKLRPDRRQLVFQLDGNESMRRAQEAAQRMHATRIKSGLREFRGRELAEARNMSNYTGSSGGYLTMPESFMSQLEINLLAYGGMRQVAEAIRTQTGERMGWPSADDTSNVGEQLGENSSIGSSVEPSLAKTYWDAFTFSSKAILVPYALLQDSAFNLPALLGAMMGERLGRITNTRYTTGSGGSMPKGIVTAATLGYTAASGTAIAADEILRLIHSVDPAYRTGAGFMMHDSITLALQLLKDGQGRYLWGNGLASGQPDQLAGYPVTINQDMDSTMASGKKTLLYGQLSKYKIRSVQEARMYRLEERYRDTDNDGFIMLIREDGNLLDAGSHPVKYLLHP